MIKLEEYISGSRNYSVMCNDCDFVHTNISERDRAISLGMDHYAVYSHNVKLLTYEKREYLIMEQYL